jgi:protein ImuB
LPHPSGLQAVERPWLDGRPLRLLSGPERIESGWWDGEAVARDYFIAGDEEGALLWVYRQRLQATAAAEGISQGSPGTAQPPAHWFLHGWFG